MSGILTRPCPDHFVDQIHEASLQRGTITDEGTYIYAEQEFLPGHHKRQPNPTRDDVTRQATKQLAK